jgi:periplasmic divalent cation tolerance protein
MVRRGERNSVNKTQAAAATPRGAHNARMSALLVFTTVPSGAADRLARGLVDERLAACVQALPGLRSTYRWEGAVQQASETLLLIKTTAERYAALERWLSAHHSYELPEILAVDASAGLPAYLHWLADETASGETGDAD